MYFYPGRFCYVQELSTDNEKDFFLFLLKNRFEYQRKVSNQVIPTEYKDYLNMIKVWFNNGRNYQFLVYDKRKNLIGTIFFYALNSKKKTIKISCYFSTRGQILIGESIGATIELVSNQIHEINNIVFDVYNDNTKTLSLAIKIGAVLEEKSILSTTGSKKLISRYILNELAIKKIIRTFNKITRRIN